MSRGPSKAKLILAEAQERVNLAQAAVRDLESRLGIANVTLYAYQDSYKALEAQLAPTPRKVKDPKSSAPSAKGKSSPKEGAKESTASIKEQAVSASTASDPQTKPGPLCAICGDVEAFEDHNVTSLVYHKFRTSLKKKNGKSNGAIPENPETLLSEATA